MPVVFLTPRGWNCMLQTGFLIQNLHFGLVFGTGVSLPILVHIENRCILMSALSGPRETSYLKIDKICSSSRDL